MQMEIIGSNAHSVSVLHTFSHLQHPHIAYNRDSIKRGSNEFRLGKAISEADIKKCARSSKSSNFTY